MHTGPLNNKGPDWHVRGELRFVTIFCVHCLCTDSYTDAEIFGHLDDVEHELGVTLSYDTDGRTIALTVYITQALFVLENSSSEEELERRGNETFLNLPSQCQDVALTLAFEACNPRASHGPDLYHNLISERSQRRVNLHVCSQEAETDLKRRQRARSIS